MFTKAGEVQGEPDLAEAVKALSEAILSSKDLTSNRKNELVETLSIISTEASALKEKRRSLVANSLLDKAIKITSVANDIADICHKFWPVIAGAFATS